MNKLFGVPTANESLPSIHYSLLTLLQLRLDSFGDVVETGEALEFLDDFAVTADEEASGITEQAAELRGDFAVPTHDGIVHPNPLSLPTQPSLAQQRTTPQLPLLLTR